VVELPGSSSLIRSVVIVVVAVAAILSVVYFAKGLSRLSDAASANSKLSYADRDIAGGNGVVVDQNAAYEARAIIPSTDRYRVVTGTGVRGATSLTLPFVGWWFQYFLMPRRPDPRARWVVCYGCDTSKLGGTFAPRWADDSGISIGSVR
jgi:hypothetical protein